MPHCLFAFIVAEHIQGTKPLSGEYITFNPLPRVIKIRAHMNNLKKKAKVMSKKAANHKKELPKASKVLTEANREVDHL